jgi:hypothetical protein
VSHFVSKQKLSNIIQPFLDNFLPDFCWLFTFGFCVYLCSHLPYTFDGWVLILDIYLQGFSSFLIWQTGVKAPICHSCSWMRFRVPACFQSQRKFGQISTVYGSFVCCYFSTVWTVLLRGVFIKAKSFVESSPSHATSLVGGSDPC